MLSQASVNDHRNKICHWPPQMSEATKSHLHSPNRIPNSVGYMAIQWDNKSLPTDLFLDVLNLLDMLALLALKTKHFSHMSSESLTSKPSTFIGQIDRHLKSSKKGKIFKTIKNFIRHNLRPSAAFNLLLKYVIPISPIASQPIQMACR